MKAYGLAGSALALLLIAAPVALFVAMPICIQAQSTQRSVEGRVTDAQNQTVDKAIVFLKDKQSLAIKSVNTGKDGVSISCSFPAPATMRSGLNSAAKRAM